MDITSKCLELSNMSYDDQLNHKIQLMKKYFPNHCGQMIASPKIDYYRNKLRFDVGLDHINNIVIGYALPKKISNKRYVYTATDMKHVSHNMSEIITDLQNYLNNDKKPWYSIEYGSSSFQSLTIRTSFNTNDLMIIANFNKKFDDDVTKYFYDFDTKYFLNIVIIFTDKMHVVRGSSYIHEKLSYYLFRISCNSFFQVNTLSTELLYDKVKTLMQKYISTNKDTNFNILFDLCCGTGTIGIYLANLFTKSIGIDISQSNIIDANHNKTINKIFNIEFICSPIECCLQNIIDETQTYYENPNFFAVVDPPRTGMHGGVQNVINNCQSLKYVIYVSCNVVTLNRDMKILEKSFDICDVYYVDLFPHTPHCEVIMVLERKKID
ncbi:RNA methyltransferase [Cotonvirus japonicus]|uniref:RNA methyltransferase n=1 Tax=Cotonvirus japonicus TaxID=2811091 RepID=A0ABM7NSL3_9VIRU|nr:RNA methyltransferase [Cotonvirus japonicus]BCS83154.1 RNA methyltransferase [Cotonvirus japonicus]